MYLVRMGHSGLPYLCNSTAWALTTSSFVCYCIVFFQICKYDIEESVRREMSGDLKEGMVTIGRQHRVKYPSSRRPIMAHCATFFISEMCAEQMCILC